MKDIPTRFIISSRLSTLEPKEIIRIVYLAGSQWNEKQVKERMEKYPNRPLMGVGISNPQELSQVIKNDIPVIHIQDDCKALLGVQKRWVRNTKIWNRILELTSASVWGLFSYKVMNTTNLIKRGESNVQFPVFKRGNLPIPNQVLVSCIATFTLLLSLLTKNILNRIRNEYSWFQKENESVLIRNDVQYTTVSFLLRNMVPYCFIGFSVYHLRKSYK